MSPIPSESLSEFLENTASSSVTPAGGSSIASTAAIGAALCEMTCIHRGDRESGDGELRDTFRSQREQLLDLAEADAKVIDEAFAGDAPVSPGENPQLITVPRSIGDICVELLDAGFELLSSTQGFVSTDAACGLWIIHGALSAVITVLEANLVFLDDEDERTELTDTIDRLESEADRAHGELRAWRPEDATTS